MKKFINIFVVVVLLALAFFVVASTLVGAQAPSNSIESLRAQHAHLQELQDQADASYEQKEKIACKIAALLALECIEDEEKCSEATKTFEWLQVEHGYFNEVCVGLMYDTEY